MSWLSCDVECQFILVLLVGIQIIYDFGGNKTQYYFVVTCMTGFVYHFLYLSK